MPCRMNTDALSRRTRFANPQPTDSRIEISRADIALFDAIQRHGPLPTDILYLLAKDKRSNLQAHKHRLTQLYNGTADGRRYLTRPQQQFNNREARYQPVIHDLGIDGWDELERNGVLLKFCPPRTDPMIHRFFAATIGASIELQSRKCNVRYIHEEEFGRRIQSNRRSITLAGIPQRTVIPDFRFALEYTKKPGFRFCAVEIDRNTESGERNNREQTSMESKLQGYDQAFSDKAFKDQWDVPNLTVLIYTTNERHAQNILELVKRLRNPKRFLVRSNPSFATRWTVPRTPLPVEQWRDYTGKTVNIFEH